MGEDNIEPSEFDTEIYTSHFRVAVFGSARIKKNDPRFQEIYALSKMIAKENIDIVTGGGPGLMHAANKGAMEGRRNNSVLSLGLNIKLPHEQKTNRHLDIKKEFDRFSDRLDNFMLLSNVVLIAPGGVGTLLELFYTWQLVQVEHIINVPIILYGEMWKEFLEWVKKYPLKQKFLDKTDLNMIFYAKDITQAFALIKEFHDAFMKGGMKTRYYFRQYQTKKRGAVKHG